MSSEISKTLDQKIWFPHVWFFLNTIAYTYPETPTQVTKRKYYDFIQNLPLFLPNEEISNQFSHLLDAFPVTPYLANKDSFSYWIHFIHNKINKRLEKPCISLMQFYENYYEQYKPKETKWRQLSQWKKRAVYCVIVLSLIYVAYTFYYK